MKRMTDMYFDEIRGCDPLTREEEKELFKAYRERGCRKAFGRLLTANSKFVAKMAFHYNSRSGHHVGDLIGVGNVAMAEAVETFDYERGMRFTSWAVWLIKAMMLKEMASQGRFVSVHGSEAYNKHKLDEAARKLAQKLHREPTSDELSEETGIPAGHVEHMMQVLQSQTSLDSSREGAGLHEVLAADSRPEETPESIVLVDRMLRTANLPERDLDVVRMYCGIGYSESSTLQEIADKYGLTREAVRQIKKKALAKLAAFNEVQKAKGKKHLDPEMIP